MAIANWMSWESGVDLAAAVNRPAQSLPFLQPGWKSLRNMLRRALMGLMF